MLHDVTAAVWAELLKTRRSPVPWVTGAAFAVAGLVGAFFMYILADPDRAQSFSMAATKSQFAGGSADWTGYFGLTAQIVAVGGLLVFGLVVIWLFGREFADHTLKDLLALPTSRSAVVGAKLIVAFGWCLLLALEVIVLALIFGVALDLPGWSTDVVAHGLWTVLSTTVLTIALAIGYALVASIGRGYLAAVGAMFGTLFAAQVVAALGLGAWFPWSVPALLSGSAGPDAASPGVLGIAGTLLVGVLAGAGTMRWWERVDQDR